MEKLVVSNYDISMYSIVGKNETEAEAIQKIIQINEESLSIVESKVGGQYDNDGFFTKETEYYTNILDGGFTVVTEEEFQALQRRKYLDGNLIEVTEEDFENALDVLPPIAWCTIDGVEMFCISEMTYSTFTTQYARYNGKYYCMTVDLYDKSTWINNILREI